MKTSEGGDELAIVDPTAFEKVEGNVVLTIDNDIVVSTEGRHPCWQHQQLKAYFYPQRPTHFLGYYNGQPCFTLELEAEEVSALAAELYGLRHFLGRLPEGLFRLLGRAVQINNWYRHHRYCGCCGALTRQLDGERAMGCDNCGTTFYPRLSPCIMALITRGPHCLLARNVQWQRPMFSVLAGFVEPGESVEQAVHREVMEEVGLKVGELRYFASQPWPFPGQLMLGFFADYQSGEVAIDGIEIGEADWFHYRELPPIPGEFSLSGQLIRAFVEQSGELYGN